MSLSLYVSCISSIYSQILISPQKLVTPFPTLSENHAVLPLNMLMLRCLSRQFAQKRLECLDAAIILLQQMWGHQTLTVLANLLIFERTLCSFTCSHCYSKHKSFKNSCNKHVNSNGEKFEKLTDNYDAITDKRNSIHNVIAHISPQA